MPKAARTLKPADGRTRIAKRIRELRKMYHDVVQPETALAQAWIERAVGLTFTAEQHELRVAKGESISAKAAIGYIQTVGHLRRALDSLGVSDPSPNAAEREARAEQDNVHALLAPPPDLIARTHAAIAKDGTLDGDALSAEDVEALGDLIADAGQADTDQRPFGLEDMPDKAWVALCELCWPPPPPPQISAPPLALPPPTDHMSELAAITRRLEREGPRLPPAAPPRPSPPTYESEANSIVRHWDKVESWGIEPYRFGRW